MSQLRLYKNPDFPIWVLASPTHYTMIFSTQRSDSQLSEEAVQSQSCDVIWRFGNPTLEGKVGKVEFHNQNFRRLGWEYIDSG